VSTRVVPKVTLISPARNGGHVSTRTFIPHKCHAAIGVLMAVTVGTACLLPSSVAQGIVPPDNDPVRRLSIEHPSGEFFVEIEVSRSGSDINVVLSSLIRTARALFRGEVLVPASIWDGTQSLSAADSRADQHV